MARQRKSDGSLDGAADWEPGERGATEGASNAVEVVLVSVRRYGKD